MKILAYDDSSASPAVFTPWSLVHFCVGILWGLVSNDWIPLFLMATAYEIKDVYFEKKYTVSVANSIGDILVAILGHWMYLRYGTPLLYTVPLTLLFLFSQFSSKDGKSWTTDIWHSRG